ncbi:protein transport protein Sec16A [Trichonephila clavata]|uniref:Protein transport protein sec16 n=1 Tax=Trichonephila clavata TaxID=2740835 RepID=A0A8X6L2B4_TRICU|nr:protein transport protein Sec16A [Trichonephila clavata]
MSRRLLQRGRYPKAPAVETVSTTNASYFYYSSQFPQNPPVQTPQMSYYDPNTQSQNGQNSWAQPSYPNPNTYQPNQVTHQPAYPNPTTYQQNQAPLQPVPDSAGYWSGGQMHPVSSQPQWNEPWPLNKSENVSENTSYANYQQPPPMPTATEQWQLQQQVPYSQVDNQKYPQQVTTFHQAGQQDYQHPVQYQTTNNNSQAVSSNNTLPLWENGSLEVSQPEHLSWTYGAPQYSNPIPAPMQDFPPNSNSATNTMSWPSDSVNYVTSNNSDFNVHDRSSSNYLLTNTENITVVSSANSSPPVEQSNACEDEVGKSKTMNSLSNIEDNSSSTEHPSDVEHSTSMLSAFFQNNVPEESGEYSDNISTASVPKEGGESSSQEERDSPILEIVSKVTDSGSSFEEQATGNESDTNFVQEEKAIDLDVDERENESGFIEEPINQEVPEPPQDETSKILQTQSKQKYDEISSEEPPNQEIPAKSGQTSRSTSSERERVIIRPREESPFKPPRPNSSKGVVVQQEVSIQNHPETKYSEGKTVVQEVNLETFPDNLERPSDYEELKKQSPLYSSRKHLRSELNSSPSSLLCDNLDIPCVTLAPAAPPLSSAKSDKSESSTDSKSEMLSFGKPNLSTMKLSEPNSSSSSSDMKDANTYEKSKNKHMSRKESNNTHQSRNRETNKSANSQHKQYDDNSQSPKDEKSTIEKDYYPVYLKDSKINGSSGSSRDSLSLRQTPSNTEYSDTSLPPSRNGRRDVNYPVNDRNDPRYGNDRTETGRQRFADQKYPSFDERQYYSDRERSRPSSRNSLKDRSEDYPFQPRPDDYYHSSRSDPRRYPPDYERPSSRMSESDGNRGDRPSQGYYRQQYAYPPNAYPKNDYYQRPPQRGYEYDHYSRDPYYSSYYDAYRYAYSNFNYGFYDELYRNDPRYKEYQEQYRQYYAKHGYDVDYDRSSVHSGRSSANELTKGGPQGNYEPDDSNESEFSSYNLDQKYGYGSGQNEISNIDADQISTPSSRLTPVKFSYAHPIARFSPGGLLITGIPCQTSSVPAMPIRIQNLQAIREDEESFQELKSHQGPLIRGLTHKNDVIEFCNLKIKSIKSLEDIVDRDSYMLLWELMVLLLRQNGSVAGSDIAELLLRDHEVLRPPTLPLKPAVDTPQGEHSPADVNDSSSQSHAGDTSSPDEGIVVLNDKTLLNTSRTVDVDKLTRKFREFLLFGHKKDALEWAMKHGLWGHALFLASKMDVRTYANVMTRFANSLALNDPLQTLYQLMSGRQPLAVTNVADKRWGDWRPHLAMILSNPSAQPDVDSRSITTLGDTLASKGCLCAAHFCYIMAQVDFGTYEQKNSKLVLLTADHSLPFEEFASNEAIQLTEIYEYAQSLANASYMLVHLQLYKFLYALRLVEHGFLEEALHYCEIISQKVQEHPHLFQLDFLSEVYKLATQLKYHDPHFLRGQGEFEDQEDPDWLKNLTSLVQNFNNFTFGEQPQTQVEQQPIAEVNDSSQSTNNLQYATTPITENVSFQNVPSNNIQNETNSSYNHVNYYQNNGWNQQNNLPNSTLPSNSPHESGGYYQGDTITPSQSNFYRQNSIPSHEENETTDVPSSPVTQTPPFDYFSGGTQQEWSSVHSLPSVCLSDACSKSDLEALVRKEETESDVPLCSSSHSTPLHNYLLSNDNIDDRRMLMTRSGLVDVRTLNSCLKSSRSQNSKHKKCIKFDASVSQGKLQKTGIRRRRFSKKKTDGLDPSDSSLEGSPSKEKNKAHHKLSLLATLGILKPDQNTPKLSKRKRKAKKKNETIEKLMQSKKTFAIDEPCDMDEKQWMNQEKSMDESVQETKKIISILKKLSDEEKKNSQLSQLMANEFNKKPPLIFGGTYPIDEPFESVNVKTNKKKSKVLCEDIFSDELTCSTKASVINKRLKYFIPTSNAGYHKDLKKIKYEQSERDTITKMSPLTMFKRMHCSHKNSREESSYTSWSTTPSSGRESNNISRESNVNENKPLYDTTNSFSNLSHRERRDSAMSSGSRYSSGSISVANKNTSKESQKAETKKEKHSAQAGKTWLGGIFSRLLPRGPNQMILPDDKNPTIVWDETKKCWKNKDSNDDDETNAPLAPPTDMELMGSKSSMKTFQTPGSSVPPSSSAAPPGNIVPPPSTTLPANKFQRQKTRGMRQNYVDILNSSGATKKTNVLPGELFPSPYESNSSPKMFVPGTTSTSIDNPTDFESNQTTYNPPHIETQEPVEIQSTPLMFDPAEYDNRKSSISTQRPTLGRTGRRTYPT